jgi:DNA processing protein
LRLIRTRNIGPMTYSLLMRRYGSAEAAIAAIPTLAKRDGSKISLASIASELGKHGYIIVSGMARGIDAAAHRGELDTGTIGVIARGVNIVYPPENADLFEEVASRGLLIAEMPPATKPTHKHFFPSATG